MNTNNQTAIRRILLGNAIFSGVSGLLFTFASASVARFLGIDASIIILLIGIGLAGYAFLLYQNASRSEISKAFVLTAVVLDSIWVLLSIILLITNWVPFATEGKWAVGIVAAIVDVFATLQFIEWRRM
ncbi:MAG: hypothetical protein C4557_00850 [Anaerolineaceae bacterium]|jgi:uncharacterized membrane protein YidH (DUF202 family)|nr:MAG: hypothetical protein C4557_00850 [Anaerolineaceae bacterium]